MGDVASDLLQVTRVAVSATFVVLALVALVRARRTGRSGWWVAAAFGAMALVLLAGWIPDALDRQLHWWLGELRIALLLAFPYLLLRFTASFRELPRWVEVAAAVGAGAAVLATLVSPPLPEGDAPQPAWAVAYIAAVLASWVLISLVTVISLWRAGRGQPTVARRRMRVMSAATGVLAVALLLAGGLRGGSHLAQLAVQLTALASALAFGLGFSPPLAVRLVWRRREVEQLQQATIAVLRVDTPQDVARELLPPTMRIVGGSGAALVDSEGRVVAVTGEAPAVGSELTGADSVRGDGAVAQAVPLGEGRGELVVWTSPYTPFFGREEVDLLDAMGAVSSLALERCALLQEERAQREVLDRARRDADSAREEAESAREAAELAREQATRANAAKTGFLSRMSHELRTPLNAILGFGQLLELSALDADDRDGVQHILKAGQHLLALINDVLDLSRIEAGMLTISLEPVEAAELVGDTVSLIQPAADARLIRLVDDMEDCHVYVTTDRQRCRQVLLNLLSNAVKYNRDSGEVHVRCTLMGDDRLRILVRDTGPGIDPARHDRLFEPFERLGAEASAVEGTGLGLALTKQLIERLGGAIGVETALGQGSTFWIDLPVTQRPDYAADATADPQRLPEGKQRTLLLVEDNLANLRLVEAMLRRRPEVSVLPAMQGGLAIDLARQHQPDVIVLDLHLPDLPGREVLLRLQADPRTRDIPVVIASADATPGRVRQLREQGAFGYVTKPLDLQEFLAVVDAALAARDTGR